VARDANLEIERGTDWTKGYTWTQSDGTTEIPLDGYSVAFEIRRSPLDRGDALLALTDADEEVAVSGGTVTTTLSAAQTAGLPAGLLWMEIIATHPTSEDWRADAFLIVS
jgi:hypothetical protein